ncbi:MAG: helicase-exonuclease AddAB subunit AddA [Acidibacillus sp.]|nr:helicase-exonuclease AddAB subunit AddA [Acidibacillus sp.]
MSARQFSDRQEEAITTRGSSVLVSAGAGSGKTSVLVERVQRLVIDEGVDIDKILIVTFTEAAANEMKERIAKGLRAVLEERPHDRAIIRQLHLLDRAHISTLHSFCLDVMRSATLQLPIDPTFRIADQQETTMLQFTVVENLFATWFEDPSNAFTDFARHYGDMFGDEQLREIILRLYSFARSQPKPQQWLDQAVEKLQESAKLPMRDSRYGHVFFSWCREHIQNAQDWILQASYLCADDSLAPYRAALQSDMAMLEEAYLAAKNLQFTELQTIVQRPFVKLGRVQDADPDVKKIVQKLRDHMKKAVGKLNGTLLARTESVLQEEIAQTVPFVQTLVDFLWQFHDAYKEAKQTRTCVDFADLEHYAYQLLTTDQGEPSKIALQLADQYEQVLVDEYQDTSPIQDAILAQIAQKERPNLFYVGDVKQSIYGFRMAEPALFLAKYDQFRHSQEGVRIDLQDNYRSRSEIVDAVNYLFGQIFSPILGGISYDDAARMNAAANYPPRPQEHGLAGVDVHIIDYASSANKRALQDEEDEEDQADSAVDMGDEEDVLWQTAIDMEAHVAGQEILRLYQSEAQVYDADEKIYRAIQWRDIVILLRSKAGRIDYILQVFRSLGIPCYGESDSGYYTSLEMRFMLALLQIVDNPRQDIPLATVLRSPIGAFSTTDLANIRLCLQKGDLFSAVVACSKGNNDLSQRTRTFLSIVDRMRTFARMHSVADTVLFLQQDSGLRDFVMGLRDGAVRLANLEQFVKQAQAFDQLEYEGFSGFVLYIMKHFTRSGDAGAAGGVAEHEDVVRIMTIHKSKGLEFPVVFILNMEKTFRLSDNKLPIRFHKDMGFGPDFVDLERKEKWKTLASVAVDALTLRQNLAEEARVLYVAATRAKEKLILVGALRNLGTTFDKWRTTSLYESNRQGPLRDSVLLGAKQYLDWIGPAIYRTTAQGSSLFHVTLWGDSFDRPVMLTHKEREKDMDWNAIARLETHAFTVDSAFLQESMDWREQIQEQLSFTDEQRVPVAAKMSVTEWKNNWMDQSEAENGDTPIQHMTKRIQFLRPTFLTQEGDLTATEKGSLFHLVMQYIELKNELVTAQEVMRQVGQLINSGFLPSYTLKHVDAESIATYFQSSVGQLMITHSVRVLREVPFTLSVPSDKLIAQSVEQSDIVAQDVIIQGTVDCLLALDGGMILVDYKTDHLLTNDVDLVKRYELQLSLYREAMERAFKQPVTQAYLYFATGKKLVPVLDALKSW